MEENRTIKPISADIKYTTSNLVEFDCIIDTDLSIIEFMLNKYNNSEYFKDEVIHSSSINAIRNLLLFRENKNPLSILFKNDYIESIDDILEEILSNYKEEIIANSHPTDVFRFIRTLNETDGVIKTRINCSNKSEQELIKKHDSSMFTVLNETDVLPYNCIFIKYLDNIIKYTNLGGKYIFMINARYNLSKDFRPKSISIIPAEYNKIRTIDPYVGLRVPIKTDLGGFNNEK